MIEVDNLREGYWTVCSSVWLRGEHVAPRGESTREVLGETILLRDPADALPIGTGRKVSVALAATEALQLIGGYSDPEALRRAAGQMEAFEDFPGYRHGAYGPRIGWKLPLALRRLTKDRDTRQAQMTIWEDARDLTQLRTRDYPCTTALQLLVRNRRLVLHTTMRSNDVWLGLAYDAFCFTQLQLTAAAHLGLQVGPYYHHAVSLHMYDRDVAAFGQLKRWSDREAPPARGIGFYGLTGEQVVDRARQIGEGNLPKGATLSEVWYYNHACHRGNAG